VHTLNVHKLFLIRRDSTKTTLRHPMQCPATRDPFYKQPWFHRHDGVLVPAASHAIDVPRSYRDGTDHWQRVR